MEKNRIYNMDCVEGLRMIVDETVDMVVTSPPYDNMKQYKGAISNWNWEVGDQTKNGSETGTSFRQALYFMEVGFNLSDTMIWKKKNPMPAIKQPRYSQEFEYMFVFSKGKPKTFNPIMVPTKCGGLVYNSTCKNIKESGESGRTHKTFKINAEKVHGNIFEIAVAQNKSAHPAVFPLKLAEIHISTWSNEGDLVLDPFIGSGTTAKAAKDLKRNYIGFDVSEEYCKIAEERIRQISVE